MVDVASLRELAGKATPGPWITRVSPHKDYTDIDIVAGAAIACVYGYGAGNSRPPVEANAGLIAACDPQTILALLDERDRLRTMLVEIANSPMGGVRASALARAALDREV